MSRVNQLPTISLQRFQLSLFEKVILVNSLLIIGGALACLWVTSYNLESHHYLIDTSFIVIITVISLAINVLLMRASFRPLFSLLRTIRAISIGQTGARASITTSDSEMSELASAFNTMLDRLEACRTIRAQNPTTHVLILTMYDSEGYFLQALRAGAAGYIVKKAAPTELQTAISAVAQGGVFLYPGLAKALVHAYLTQSSPSPTAAQAEEGSDLAQELRVLTPRELEIVTLVAEGYTNQAIADRLTLSIKTVQSHRANVMEKLGLRDITQLVRFALRHGLIDAEP